MHTQEPHPSNQQDLRPPQKPARTIAKGAEVAVRQVFAVTGLSLIIVAVPVGMLTPLLPIGLPMAIVGVILLGRNAHWGRKWMEKMMGRWPSLERFAPHWLMRLVFGRDKRLP